MERINFEPTKIIKNIEKEYASQIALVKLLTTMKIVHAVGILADIELGSYRLEGEFSPKSKAYRTLYITQDGLVERIDFDDHTSSPSNTESSTNNDSERKVEPSLELINRYKLRDSDFRSILVELM